MTLTLTPHNPEDTTVQDALAKTHFKTPEAFVLLMNEGLLKANEAVTRLAEQINEAYSNVEYNRALKTFSIITPTEQYAEKLIELGQYWTVVARLQEDIKNNAEHYTNGLFIPLRSNKSRITHKINQPLDGSGEIETTQTGLVPLADKETLTHVLDQLTEQGYATKEPVGYIIENVHNITTIDNSTIHNIAQYLNL